MAVFFDYVVIRGKRYNASHTTGSNNSSFVHVLIPQTDATPIHAYGEVLEIFQYMQNFRGVGSPMWFVQMRWLCLGQENAKIFGEPCEHVQTLQGSY
jgi:hypothetical protein